MSRTIAIGDIHGCGTALERLLEEIQPAKSDVIVGLGDYVDRGMESARVIEILIDLVAKCRFVPLIGNHEIMMFKALQSQQEFDFWFQHGGSTTVASYGGRIQNIPQHHTTFLSHCQRFFETDRYFFVHANYQPDLPLVDQPDQLLFWEHILAYPPPPHYTGKTAIVGHTPQIEGVVRNLDHVRIIDTFCYGDQWLTAHDVHSGEIFQTNNNGEFRKSWLDPPEFYDEDFSESHDNASDF